MDDLIFAPDQPDAQPNQAEPWLVLVVDDEPEVHQVTRLALQDFEFEGRPLKFLNAYSGAEAIKILDIQHEFIALALLDVVMESDHAGLELVRYIREHLQNSHMRLVLRTGQPGQAPEHKVIVDYDINDYKAKTELTVQKLSTLMYASLRGYRDIMTIEGNRRGLKQVIDAAVDIFRRQSLIQLVDGVMEQLIGLLRMDKGVLIERTRQVAAALIADELRVLVANDGYQHLIGQSASQALLPHERNLILQALNQGQHIFTEKAAVLVCTNNHQQALALYMEGGQAISTLDRQLLELFIRNVSVAFENVQLNQDIEETQREIVYLLGEAVETRSHETGHHVKRVAEYCFLLGKLCGMSDEEATILRYASPLHDLGKIGIPDDILNKPGKHDSHEWKVMKSHAELGYELLKSSHRPILQAAAIIALDHHERWDGSGYPNHKKGTDIHLYGRITAIADVFDALCSERCYKPAWPIERALELIKGESGRHFDPKLVQLFLDNAEEFIHIRQLYQD
ncbi:DUF3369 domain-containing protein [Balneatrix alpica]|uniref:DUF3369 domain-containing protein n=1 Tax=Balneatrix alpica TaxID=75684 RepID=UPI0027393F70|nr:DUF3369 domain-containing protein [Balneatrix alpica]